MFARVEIFQENVRVKTIIIKLFKETAHSLDPFLDFRKVFAIVSLVRNTAISLIFAIRICQAPFLDRYGFVRTAQVHRPTGKTK